MKFSFVFVVLAFCLMLSSCFGRYGYGYGLGYDAVGDQAAQPQARNQQSDADSQPDCVYLKDGSIIHGTIIEESPGRYIKIQTGSGNVFTYQEYDVARMTRNGGNDNSSNNNNAPAPSNNDNGNDDK